jgi:hypothetical protein
MRVKYDNVVFLDPSYCGGVNKKDQYHTAFLNTSGCQPQADWHANTLKETETYINMEGL